MLAKSDAHSDSTADLEIQPAPLSPWRVVEVVALPDYRLRVKISRRFLGYRRHEGGGFLAHRGRVRCAAATKRCFGRVGVEMGAPVWPGEIDIAPDAIYDGLQSSEEGVYRFGDTAS